ncbi:M23 family metallopeptidase, partial [Ruthenibacterium lactatiformans]
MEAVLAPQRRTARQFMAVALCTAAAVLAAGLTACAADGAAERVSGSLPKPQTAEPAGTGEEALKMRTALPESSAPEPSEGVLTFETSRPPVWPVPEYEYIGTQFGASHRGIDIGAREGAEIVAVWGGTVLEAEEDWNYGQYVRLDNGGGLTTLYAHCSELLVQPGDTVKAGEAVARVGNTGVASGNHCHLELERNGVLLDPMQELSAPRDATPRTQARQPEPQNTETWLPPDNELIKERLAGTTGVWPVPEYTFVSRSVGRYHRGMDIAAKKGADIVAPFSGTVTRAEDGEETQYWVYGKYVEIALDGDPGVRVRLTHCSELLVQPGDTVRAGQPVARVGSTGNSTGNHCHLELLADEYYTDPELILTRPEP